MDCNREEALRAKEVAEQKFTAKDVVGAKKFALKAQNIFPALEGISQMIATLDVYLAAQVKINGESDLYAILSVNASADDETVKRQYRRLALQLHPDKNKSIGAEGAFKLISEAWSVLSDKSRKMVYDQKRSVKRAPQTKRENSIPNASNGMFSFTNNAPSTGATKSAAPPSSRPSKINTFWTSCDRCRMQYEYLRVYLNHNLLCPNCHEPFLAIERGFPIAPQQRRQNLNHNSTLNPSTVQGMGNTGFQHGGNLHSYNNPKFQWPAGAASSSAAAQAANMVHETCERVRKEREESQRTARREGALRRKNHVSKRNMCASGNSDVGMTGNVPDREWPIPKADRTAKKRRSTDFGGNETMASGFKVPPAAGCFNSNMVPEMGRANGVSQMGSRNVLMEKAKVAIHKKLEEWNSAASAKLAEKEEAMQKQKQNDKEKAAATDDGDVGAQNKLDGTRNDRNDDKQIPVKKEFSEKFTDIEMEAIQPVSIDVPDADFHDFDQDRSEGSFEVDQIWATYDSEDGMPRLYAFVQKVISLKPFKIRMSFLSSKSNSELGPFNWVASGFAKTCGDFRVGRYEVKDTVNIFSHRLKWEKGARGVIRIFPRKGDAWALYRNWSSTWNEHTPDDVVYKYDMVEVLDDYNEEQGVAVTPLVKVAGFKTVFHRHLDPKEVKRIPREEMFRFSHQVPSHLLTGEEAHNAPRGCRELDPAATPIELLQVITELKEDELMETPEQQPVS